MRMGISRTPMGTNPQCRQNRSVAACAIAVGLTSLAGRWNTSATRSGRTEPRSVVNIERSETPSGIYRMDCPSPGYVVLFPDSSYIKMKHFSMIGFAPVAFGSWSNIGDVVVAQSVEPSSGLPPRYRDWTSQTFSIVMLPEGVSLWDEDTVRTLESEFGMPIEDVVRKKMRSGPQGTGKRLLLGCYVKCKQGDWSKAVTHLTEGVDGLLVGSLEEDKRALVLDCRKADGEQKWDQLRRILISAYPELGHWGHP